MIMICQYLEKQSTPLPHLYCLRMNGYLEIPGIIQVTVKACSNRYTFQINTECNCM